jgi:hypothetical protein
MLDHKTSFKKFKIEIRPDGVVQVVESLSSMRECLGSIPIIGEKRIKLYQASFQTPMV